MWGAREIPHSKARNPKHEIQNKSSMRKHESTKAQVYDSGRPHEHKGLADPTGRESGFLIMHLS